MNYLRGLDMKDKDKGITIIEILTVTTMVLFVIFGSLFTVKKGHEARLEGEKTFVKRVMDSGGDPYKLSPNISLTRIEQYIKEINKEKEIAGEPVKSQLSSQSIMKTPVETIVATPVINQITEKHYHFEALITAFKYIGFSILGIFTVFFSIISFSLIRKYLHVIKATKESKKILDKFDNEFEENKNYLSFIRKMSEQVILNSVLIDNRKNKETVLSLIVTNEILKERLNFLENNFVKIMK